MTGDELPGREREVAECWISIQERPFFIIEGKRGSGKTSIVNAGLMPLADKRFRVVRYTIGDDPVNELRCALKGPRARKLARPAKLDSLMRAIQDSARDASDAASTGAKDLLLILDQFENLFDDSNEGICVRFIAVLKKAIEAGLIRLVVVIQGDYFECFRDASFQLDPKQQTLDFGSSYTLGGFEPGQAELALKAILAPKRNADSLHLSSRFERFGAAFVKELVRTSGVHNNVLPAEMQVAGSTMESLIGDDFTVSRLKALGGVDGLLRIYTTKAIASVAKAICTDCSSVQLILKQLLCPDSSERVSNAETLAISSAHIHLALRSLERAYLIYHVPINNYALHERVWGPLARFELLFNRNASNLLSGELCEGYETLPAIPHASEWMHRRVIWGVGAVGLLTTLIVVGGLAWTTSNSYQIKAITKRAPVSQASPSTTISWLRSLARAGYTEAAVSEAIKTRREDLGPAGLIAIAEGLSQAGSNPEALRVLDQAESQTSNMQDPAMRSRAIARVACANAELGRGDAAFRLAHSIADQDLRSRAILTISWYLARKETELGDAVKALDQAEQSRSTLGIHANPFGPIAIGGGQASSVADQDMSAAHEVGDDTARINQLRDSARQATKSRDFAQADRIEDRIETIKSEIEYELLKATATSSIAKQHAREGRPKQALNFALDIEYATNRFAAISEITEEAIRLGQYPVLLSAVKGLDGTYIRSGAFAAMAKALLSAGRTVEANRAINESLYLARKVRDSRSRSRAVLFVCRQMVKAGRFLDVRRLAEAVDEEFRCPMLTIAIVGLAQAGRAEEAKMALQADLPIIVEFGCNGDRLLMFRALTEVLAKEGDINCLVNIAGAIEYEDTRLRALGAIVEGLARAGTTDEALKIARAMPAGDLRSRALETVVEGLATERKVYSAKGVAQEIDQPEICSRARCFLAIAVAHLRNYRLAREIADSCAYADDKPCCLT